MGDPHNPARYGERSTGKRPLVAETKRCSKCKEEKPLSEYLVRTDRPNSQRYSSCNTCKAAFTRSRYRERRGSSDMGYWSWLMLRSIRKRAKVKGWVCNISPEDIFKRVQEADGNCSYCGSDLDFFAGYKGRQRSASVDRLNSTVGYTSENIIICCYRCNAVKNDATPDELRKLADAIDKHLKMRTKNGRSS